MIRRVLEFLGVFLIVDIYLFFGIKAVFAKNKYALYILLTYLVFTLISYGGIYAMFKYFQERPINATLGRNLLVGFSFSLIVFKLLALVFFLFDDVIRILQYISRYFSKLIGYTDEANFGERRSFLIKLGLGLAALPFASMLYGITRGKYNYKVKDLNLDFPNLPTAFHNFKIVQISDIHSGSFDSVEDVQRGVDMINAQNPDVVLFTGDLVNSDSREVIPFIEVFKSIKAPVYSVLGNHDYSHYNRWESKEAMYENAALMDVYQRQMNFELLKNEHRIFEKDGEEIALIGVENWGQGFSQQGDLDKALAGVDTNLFKILMSHDPTHWDEKTIPHKTKVDLTLAGHTHGMQFGVDIPGFKWSPSAFRYKRWSGLYEQASQYLYVNRGFGFIGFPGRVGMWPEITAITLKNNTHAS